MRIYVGNLARDVTEAELQQAFAEFGQVSSVTILKDRETGEPRGFGFVEMPAEVEARRALAGLSGRALKGRALRVDEARPRSEWAPREGRASDGGYSGGLDGRSAERALSRSPARSMERGPERGADRVASRVGDRATGRAADGGPDRAAERVADHDEYSRRQPRGERDTRGDSQRPPWGDWGPPPLPFSDDWNSPPRGEDDEGQSARGNRSSRATGKRDRDDPDGGDRQKAARYGSRGGRGRRNRHENDEDDW